MAVNAHGSSKGNGPEQPTMPEINTEIKSKPAHGGLTVAECDALRDEVRATPGWWSERHGDLHHRYLFVWRWWEPATPILFCYSVAHWRALHAGIEKQLGPGTDPRVLAQQRRVAALDQAKMRLKGPGPKRS